jgi:uncharacterized alkaline shock family protein YloU
MTPGDAPGARATDSTRTLPPVDETAERQQPDRRGEPGEGGSQAAGELTIDDRVVEKVARQAVREVDRAGGVSRTLLGVPIGSDDDDAQVTARVDGPVATVQVRMAVLYPNPIRRVADETRLHICRRVHDVTGLEVPEVDITVTRLSSQRVAGARVR